MEPKAALVAGCSVIVTLLLFSAAARGDTDYIAQRIANMMEIESYTVLFVALGAPFAGALAWMAAKADDL